MTRLLILALSLLAGLAFAQTTSTSTSTTSSTSTSTTIDTNDAALYWSVVGSIDGFPGISATDTFTCAGLGSCQAQIGGLLITFTGDSSSRGKITFEPKDICGKELCTASIGTDNTHTTSPAATLDVCTYTMSADVVAYMPKSCTCFGGSLPAFHVRANATATYACAGPDV